MAEDFVTGDAIIVLLNHGGARGHPASPAAVERGAGFMAVHYGKRNEVHVVVPFRH